METQAAGSVIVAPNVLMNLVALGLREVPGVARPGSAPRVAGQHRGDGIALIIDGWLRPCAVFHASNPIRTGVPGCPMSLLD